MIKACVFCGSKAGTNPRHTEVAIQLGKLLQAKNIGLVYGGGKVGLMGVIADAMLESDGHVVGVIPQSLMNLEVGHTGITELHVVAGMHTRKEMMYNLSNMFIALPGGFGTLDEFCEILTWSQLGDHTKPIAFLNTNGFFNHLLAHFEYASKEGFVSEANLSLYSVADTPEELINLLLEKLKD